MLKRVSDVKKYLSLSYGKVNEREFTYEEYENISHFYEYKKKLSPDENYIDDITWHDVNMDDVFLQVNNTNSSVGQEYLYYVLRNADVDMSELKERDRVIEFFQNNEEKRNDVWSYIYKIGYAKKISICDYIDNLLNAPGMSNVLHLGVNVLLIATLLIMFFGDVGLGVSLFFVAAMISITSYYSYKAKVESYFVCVKYIVKMAKCGNKILKLNIAELEKYNSALSESIKSLESSLKFSWLLSDSRSVDGSLLEVFLDYVRMITHADLIKFNSIIKQLDGKREDVFDLYETLGYIESMIAVSSYRKLLPYYTKPEFKENTISIKVEELYHPLIVNPVANSIKVDRCVLLTGSNASGKSTFLKSIAINAILSQTIYTGTNKSYVAPQYRIFSSIALSDNLSGGESYYMVEIKSLKRILEAAMNDGEPVLCFVDEVLRGTNTVERIAASSQILKSFALNNTMCFAATHDIELTSILSEYYDNYHFREEVVDNDIKFNYHLYEGPATTKNAIKLLGIIGYDESIIKASEAMANGFVTTGEWKKMEALR